MAAGLVPGWNVIRRLGEHRMLARAALLAVVAVPVVAGLWPAIRAVLALAGVEAGDLPLPLALGFLAGLLAIAGRAVYLNRAAYVIRDHQREEYVYKLIQGYKAEPAERHLASLRHAIENFHGHPGRPPAPCAGSAPRTDAERYELIRRYAEYHYDAASRADPAGRAIAALLYGGVVLLGLIIALQLVLLVARQAGMLRILGIAP
jgi:hypothetical protein